MARVRSLIRESRACFVAALLILVGMYAGAVAVAPSLADTLTVTARLQEQFCDSVGCWVPPHNKTTPRLVFVKTFRDSATIVAVREAINGISRRVPGASLFSNGMCGSLAEAGLYYYDLQFSRFGVLLQDVTVDSRCPFWHVSTLGMPSVFDRFSQEPIDTIAHLTGMPTVP